MTTLVTGGLGFVGSYVLRNFLSRGDRLVTLDWMVSRNAAHEVLGRDDLERLTVISGDVSDPQLVARVVKEHDVRRIVHLAALLPAYVDADPPAALRVNCQGLVNVLEAARLFNVERVVWASSCSVLGSQGNHPEGPVTNDAPHYPENLYAATKSFGEHLAEHYHQAFGVDVIGLRFNTIYGQGRQRSGTELFNELFVKPTKGEPSVIPLGDTILGWQHVEDVAGTVIAAHDASPTKTRAFNTCGFPCAVRTVANLVQELVPAAQFTFLPVRMTMVWDVDDSLAVAQLGYRGRITIEEGVRRTLRELGVNC